MSDTKGITENDLPDLDDGRRDLPTGGTREDIAANLAHLLSAPDLNADLSLFRIPVQVTAVIGRSVLLVSELLKLGRGAVIELDTKGGAPIDLYVNNRRIARGELIVNEDKLSISMTEVLKVQDG